MAININNFSRLQTFNIMRPFTIFSTSFRKNGETKCFTKLKDREILPLIGYMLCNGWIGLKQKDPKFPPIFVFCLPSILLFVHAWYCSSSFCFCFSMLSIPSLGYSLSSHSLHLCFNNRFNCLMCVLNSSLKNWSNHNSLLELYLYSLFI